MNISKNKPGYYFDILLLLTVLIFSAIISSTYMSDFIKNGYKPSYYQNLFSPAVLDACGRGFKVPILKEESRVKEFLDLKKDHFSCKDLEEKLPIRVGLNVFTGQTQYLMKLVAWTWSIRGISWSALAPLFVIFYSINIGILYGLFRLGMGRGVAFAGSVLLSISWVHLSYLPHLRDYSKATFLLALILVLGCLVKWGKRRVDIVILSAVFGLVTGIGLGFRQDILICIPPLIMTLFFFLPCGVSSNFRAKFEGLLISSILMLLAGWGPLFSMEQGQNGWHAAVLGLAPTFTNALGLNESIYQWVAKYDDKTVQAMVSIYSYNRDLVYAFVSTSQYDKITAEYFLEFAKLFPADFLTRVLGSITKILNLAFLGPISQSQSNPSVLEYIFRGQQAFMSPFMNWGLGIVAMTLLLQSAHKIRFALYSTLFLFYFSAIQTLQFNVRHHFYLEFVFWWCLGFIIYHAWTCTRKPIRDLIQARIEKASLGELLWTKKQWLKWLSKPLKFGGIVILLIIASLLGLREYQEGRLKEIFSVYEKAELTPLKWQVVPKSHNLNLIGVDDFIDKNSLWPMQNNVAYGFQYLVVEFHPHCESSKLFGSVSAKFQFGRENGSLDLSKNYKVILPSNETKPTRVYYPVHPWNDNRGFFTFKGLGLNPRDMTCLKGFYKVKKPLSLSPLNLILTLPPDWESHPLSLSLK
jgi:hypothetical protein